MEGLYLIGVGWKVGAVGNKGLEDFRLVCGVGGHWKLEGKLI